MFKYLPLIIFVAGLLGVGGYFGYDRWKTHQAEKTVTEWINAQPVYAMILKEHPSVAPRFFAHFIGPYQRNGMAGLATAKIEMQQIINVNYLIDYIWYVDDAAIRNYIVTEYNFLTALQKSAAGRSLCAQYIMDSSKFAEADKTAGGDLFNKYMDASEKLVLSAAPHKLYPVWPGVKHYRDSFALALTTLLLQAAQDLRTNPQLAEALQNREKRDCSAATLIDYMMLKGDPRLTSLVWRGTQELTRDELVKQRKANGSE